MNVELIDDRTPLAIELRKRIQAYKAKNPHLTSFDIAKRFGLAPATFHRLENSEIKNPSFEQVSKVLRGIGSQKELYSFIEKHYPDILQTVRSELSRNFEKEQEMTDSFLRAMADERDGKVLRYISSKRKSITYSEIERVFGESGCRSIENLIEKGVVELDGDRIIVEETFMTANRELVKEMIIQEFKESYDLFGAAKGEALNYIHYLNSSVDAEKVMPLIVDELHKYITNIKNIIFDEKNMGDTPMWVAFGCDTFVPNKLRIQKINKE